MQESLETIAPSRHGGHPHLIFFCELDGPELRGLIERPGLLRELATNGYSVALALHELGDTEAAAVGLLNRHGVAVIGWLLLPASEGFWFNLQNYPQAVERYYAFRRWARANTLHFQAIGLDIEPPVGEVDHIQRWGLRDLARRVWLARENVLFAAARAAYSDLIAEIHHDGYEVHTYQLPILADDRRAGTTLSQRALDIIDLPADVEVLLCYSSLPVDAIGNDLGGALIANYGPAADSIGVGSISTSLGHEGSSDGLPPLSWEAFERDLLLAAHYTDMIYIFSLEGCVERGLLARLAQINWNREPAITRWKYLLVAIVRGLLLVSLLLARFRRSIVAWLGWGIAAVLLVRQFRAWRTLRH